MSQPFQVGTTYRNRAGEYVVQAIAGDEMTIHYVGGSTLKTKVNIQARIWENIQFEEQMAREEERQKLAKEASQAARRRTALAKKARAKPPFKGFVPSDFEPKKRGITWSSREALGRLLVGDLSQRTGAGFGFWIIPRQSEIHIAQVAHYDRDQRDSRAAFFVSIDERGVAYGLRVGNPGGKAKKDWHRPAFLAALAEDGKPRRSLRAAMKKHGLSMDVYARDGRYGQVGQLLVQERGFLLQQEEAEQSMTKRMSWQDVVEYLQEVAPKQQSDVFIRKLLPAESALKAGQGVSAEILQVFKALLPIYDAIVAG